MKLLNYLFPPSDSIVNTIGENISQISKSKFKIHDEICYICKKTSKNFQTHFFCNKNNLLDQVITCFYYTKEIKPFLIKLKYGHNKNLAKIFGEIMSTFLKIYIKNLDNTAMSFVPMHWFKKYFVRGYNQAELLADQIAKLNNLPLIKICKKSKYTLTQTKTKNKSERLSNIQNTFQSTSINLSQSINQIIIVDDIITTGATLEEVAKCIKAKYPKIKIIGLVLARR